MGTGGGGASSNLAVPPPPEWVVRLLAPSMVVLFLVTTVNEGLLRGAPNFEIDAAEGPTRNSRIAFRRVKWMLIYLALRAVKDVPIIIARPMLVHLFLSIVPNCLSLCAQLCSVCGGGGFGGA